jgi:hypothetical protein
MKAHALRESGMSGPRFLLVVEDTFAISGRGLIVAPDVDRQSTAAARPAEPTARAAS